MRHLLLAVVIASSACSKTPEEAAQLYTAMVSDGFQSRGGVAVSEQHAIADLELIESSESTSIRVGAEAGLNGRILNRDSGLRVALLYLDRGVSAPALGDSGALESGSPIHVGFFGADGVEKVSGAVTGIRSHKKRWYFETNAALKEEHVGTGVYSDSGELIGVYAFELTPELRYILPIEYLTALKGAPAASVVSQQPSDAFQARAKEAAASNVTLTPPPKFSDLTVAFNFANTSLIGKIEHLRNQGESVVPDQVNWVLSAVGDGKEREEVAKGAFDETNLQWHMDEEKQKNKREVLLAQFGEELVSKQFDPYNDGELRFRIAAGSYCDKIQEATAYALVIDLGDGRQSDELTYNDLVNVCAGLEAGDGAAWEKEWGMPEPAAAKPGKKSGKGKKRRKGRKRR
ncbi:MAG: hypothetical protein AAF654_09060 [Myxococcota bacterium]